MSNLINKRAVRKLALDIANNLHPQEGIPDTYTDSNGRVWNYSGAKKHASNKRYKQVSASFLDHINSLVRVNVEQFVKKMPNKGSTIK